MTLDELIAAAVTEVAEAEAEAERQEAERYAQRREAELQEFQVLMQEKLPRLYPFVATWGYKDMPFAEFGNGMTLMLDENWALRRCNGVLHIAADIPALEQQILLAMARLLKMIN
jgi:hypothetical protein